MIERDYLMRILRQFFDVLQKLINGYNPEQDEYIEVQLNGLCENYVGIDLSFVENNDLDCILDITKGLSPSDAEVKLTMLSELLYTWVTQPTANTNNRNVAEKALALFLHIDKESRTFSFERQQRIAHLQSLLDE